MGRYLYVALLLLLTMSCNFVRYQKRFVELSIRRSGLVARQISLGVDRMAYWEGGQGPTLVLLHGFGADGTLGWSAQIPTLAKHFHLIIPDLLWFGQSHSTEADFSLEHQSRAVQKLLTSLGVSQYDIAGISYGGLVALRVMSDAPKQVHRVVIISSPGPVYTQQDYDQLLERFQVRSGSEIVLPTTPEALSRLLHIAYRKPPWVPFFAQQDVIDYLKDTPKGERAALLHHMTSDIDHLGQQFRLHPKPILIIWGSDDRMFPLEIGQRLRDYLGGDTQIKVIEGARHAPNIEFGAEFNKAMMDFLL